MTVYDRDQIREQMLKRSQESYIGVGSYRYFNIESELPLWTPKPTKDIPYIIDILPFQAGRNYPILDRANPIKAGVWVYRLEILVHQNIGPTKEWVVCPTANYGLTCPVCEEIDILQASGKEYDDFVAIALKRRCAYNVIVYDGKNDNKVQIWEVSHKYSEKPIRLQAKSPRTGGIEPFADPDLGKSISFEVANDTYKTIQGHKLVARDYVIPDEILSKVYTLDEEIVLMSYDEIDKIFHFKNEEREESQEVISPRRSSSTTTEALKEKDVPLFDENLCRFGGYFGEDIDKLEECGKCQIYDACAEEADKIALKKKMERDAKKTTSSTEITEIAAPLGRRLRRPQ